MFRHIRLASLVVILLLAALIAFLAARPRQHAAAQEKAPPPVNVTEKAKPKTAPPGMANPPNRPSALDQARSDVLTALAQYREAEIRLREAESRLRELEGRGGAAAAATPEKDGPDFHVIALKFAEAKAIGATLSEVFGRGRMAVAVDQRTNSLIIRANLDDVILAEKLLLQLDVAVDQSRKAGEEKSGSAPRLPDRFKNK